MSEETNNVVTEETPEVAATETAPVEPKAKSGFGKKLDNYFGVTKAGSTIRTELVAGLVTFLAMAYILVVNPNAITLFGANDIPTAQLFISTALGAIVGTLLMAFVAKMPLAQASGMGLNYTVGGLLVGGLAGAAVSFGNVMLLVLISGVIFLLLSIIKINGVAIREIIFDGIPACVRGAISVGIGLFIAFIGMQNCGLVVDGSTLVDLVQFNNYSGETYAAAGAVVCLVGLIAIAVLEHFKVKGGVIIGVVIATLVGIPLGVTKWSGGNWKFWENFAAYFSFNGSSEGGLFFAAFTEGFVWEGGATVIMPAVMTVITFCMIDMFDTMGTVVGCCVPVGLADKNGKPYHYDGIMMSDSIATCTGALFGTSTVTTFVESGSGIAAGGRTGLTALSCAVFFILSIFLFPLVASIPGQAAAAALLYVGSLMLKGVVNVKIDGVKNAVPAFLTIAMMPLAYSITDGIGFGILSYVLIDLISYVVNAIKYAFTRKDKPVWDLHVVTIIVAVLFLIYFFVPTVF